MVSAFAWLGFIRIDVEGDVFLMLFIIMISVFALWILLSILFFCCDELCGEMNDAMGELLWYFVGDSILFGILFIPCASLALKMFNCEKDDDGDLYVAKMPSMECWTAGHIVCCILSVIVLLLFAIGIRIRSYELDAYQHGKEGREMKRVRSDVHHIDGRVALFRFFGLVMGINIATSFPLPAATIMFVLFLYPLGLILWKVPYVDKRFDFGYVSKYAFNLWTALCVC